MAHTISKESSVNALAAKTLGKPTTGDKPIGVDPSNRFYIYDIEDVDDTK